MLPGVVRDAGFCWYCAKSVPIKRPAPFPAHRPNEHDPMRPILVPYVGVVAVALVRFVLVEIGVDFEKHSWVFPSMWAAVAALAIVAMVRSWGSD